VHTFWDEVKGILEDQKAKVIVEVGVFQGENTLNLLSYLDNLNDSKANLIAIDIGEPRNLKKMKKQYGKLLKFMNGKSEDVLPLLKDYDVVILDSDHSYDNVFTELKIVENTFIGKGKKFPTILIHDTAEPWGEKNVMPAIRNFAKESPLEWKLITNDEKNGMGILTTDGKDRKAV